MGNSIAKSNKTTDITKDLMLAHAMATRMEYAKGNATIKKQVQANSTHTINKHMEQTPVRDLLQRQNKVINEQKRPTKRSTKEAK